MNWKKFSFIALVLTFALAPPYIDYAGASSKDRQITQVQYRGDSDRDWYGSHRVDRDLYPYHWADPNQFGDDEAYNYITGGSNVPYPFHFHREGP